MAQAEQLQGQEAFTYYNGPAASLLLSEEGIMNYVIETFRPAYPQKGVCYKVHRAKGFNIDHTSPSLTSLWEVGGVTSKQEAVAMVMESAALPPSTTRMVRRIIPRG